ncbi:MAG TPA: tetratricopeptide repeat protein, partial [Ktedonobacteraceae bacterium]|nr:tetratricopeptide repeat protein [Ktedonobacteraceae bacterium]
MIEPLKIFCCYAQEDKSYFKKLKNHLTSLAMQKHITIRSTANINPGDEAQKAFQQELSTANIILLLISPDFMGSNYPEMQAALTYHEQGKARVIPILIRPTYWKDTPIARLQKLPNNDKPVADLSHWHSEDHALFNIAEQMNPIVIDLRVQQLEREIQTLDDLDNLLENYARPIALYQQIIKLKPDHAMAHNNIGDIYFSQHQYEKALHAYEEAQKLDTPFAYGYKKAEALLHLERYPESLEANRLAQLDALIGNNNPQLPDLYQQQANIYLVLNDLDNALKAYQNLLQLQPDNAHYCYKTGSLLSKLHIYDQAQAMFMNAIELQPENPDYHIALAETYYKLGKHADALASYQQLMQMINIDPSQRFRVGQLQLILQQYTQAIDSFNGSFQYGQTGAYVYYYQSQALQKLGRYEEALDYANKAIAFNMPPPDPQFLEHKRLLFELLAQETQKQAQIARLAWVKQEKFSFVPESVTLLKEFVAHTSDVNCLAITPDGCRLFSGSSNGEIKEWRPGAEEPLPEIGGHSDAITNLSISADGKTMIS